MSEIGKVLSEAADLIERDGWCQETYEDYRGRRCMDGALIAVMGDTHVKLNDVEAALSAHLPQVTSIHVAAPHAWAPVIAWNDAEGRTQEEVVAKLREVASLV